MIPELRTVKVDIYFQVYYVQIFKIHDLFNFVKQQISNMIIHFNLLINFVSKHFS